MLRVRELRHDQWVLVASSLTIVRRSASAVGRNPPLRCFPTAPRGAISSSGLDAYRVAMAARSHRGPSARDTLITQTLAYFKVDFAPAPTQPSWLRLAIATIVSIAGSLVADAVLVAVGTRVFPSSKGYVHFEFRDYARLTVIGVILGCLAWPIVTRISSDPRWLFFRMAIAVTLVLFLPDLWILMHGAPGKAVIVLICMHLAIAVVTYNAQVHIAPVGRGRAHRRH